MVDRMVGKQDGKRERGNLPNCSAAYLGTDGKCEKMYWKKSYTSFIVWAYLRLCQR
jgi:hypothetical protein